MTAHALTVPLGARLDTALRLGYETLYGADAPAWRESHGGYKLECPVCKETAWPDEARCGNCRLEVKK